MATKIALICIFAMLNMVISETHFSSYSESYSKVGAASNEESSSGTHYDFHSSSEICQYIDGSLKCKTKECGWDENAGKITCTTNGEAAPAERTSSNVHYDFHSSSKVCEYIEGSLKCMTKECGWDENAGKITCITNDN